MWRPNATGLRVGWRHGLGEVEGFQAQQCVVEGLADVVVGAGVVAASADEPTSVVVVDGDLIGAAGEPGKNARGFPGAGRRSRRARRAGRWSLQSMEVLDGRSTSAVRDGL